MNIFILLQIESQIKKNFAYLHTQMKRGGEGEKIVRKKETNEERQHGGEGGGGGGGGGGTKGTGGGLEQQSCQKHQSHARPAILFLTHGQICDSIC